MRASEQKVYIWRQVGYNCLMNHEGLMWIILVTNTIFLFREFARSIYLSKQLELAINEIERLKSIIDSN